MHRRPSGSVRSRSHDDDWMCTTSHPGRPEGLDGPPAPLRARCLWARHRVRTGPCRTRLLHPNGGHLRVLNSVAGPLHLKCIIGSLKQRK